MPTLGGIGRLVGLALLLISIAPYNLYAENPATLSEQAQTATLQFVRQHLPELYELIERLRDSAPDEYQQAVHDLHQTYLRLQRSQERTPERYELELQEWKINTRIRLLTARLAMNAHPSLEQDLRALLRERQIIRQHLLEEERDRLQKRIQQIDRQLQDQRERGETHLEREFQRLKQLAAHSDPEALRPRPSATKTKTPPAKSINEQSMSPTDSKNSKRKSAAPVREKSGEKKSPAKSGSTSMNVLKPSTQGPPVKIKG
ncbi:MAG: hypothetical protein KatS3mg114_1071 [Planctomycetaceae bacterium]|nr:MAG: hypothetical protein KatS3mg114_1071 [Planctomycetaceae bacterium]